MATEREAMRGRQESGAGSASEKQGAGAAAKAAFAEYARSYDRILPRLPFYAEVVARHVAAVREAAPKRVLDLGCGTGNVAIELAARGTEVVAIDLSEAMLGRLHEKLAVRPALPLAVRSGDAEDLSEFASGSFDAVTCLLVLYSVERPERALDEAIRVLARGGLLVITEPKPGFSLEPLLDFGRRHLAEHGLLTELAEDWERVEQANRALDPSRRPRLFVDGIARVLAARGFSVAAPRDSHLGQCATLIAKKVEP
jgi:ubiquinone/menaquinone biosynthesis C-methylase UbiE